MRFGLVPILLLWAILAPAQAVAASPLDAGMTFQMQKGDACPPAGCLWAKGMIRTDTAAQFARFLKINHVPAGAEIDFQSRGGDVLGALKLGLLVHRAGLDTHVRTRGGDTNDPGICASACAYVFLAGLHREVEDGARLGVHQFSSNSGLGDMAETQRIVAMIYLYMDTVGAEPAVERLALMTPPNNVHWLSRDEMEEYKVVTVVQRTVKIVDNEGDKPVNSQSAKRGWPADR